MQKRKNFIRLHYYFTIRTNHHALYKLKYFNIIPIHSFLII